MKDDKRLKRKVRNSYIVSTVSITLVLFLLGSVGYLMVAALKVADTLQESIAVTVELKNGLSEAQKETISKRLTAEEMVATIAYSAKEEKAEEEEFRKMFGSSFEEILPEKPAAGFVRTHAHVGILRQGAARLVHRRRRTHRRRRPRVVPGADGRAAARHGEQDTPRTAALRRRAAGHFS